MIFLYTGRLSEDPKSGSAVRPVKMLEAFKEIGYEVAEITGYSADRARGYAKVRRSIREGKTYDFCYIETTTMPMALGDPGHLPLRPLVDIRFLKICRDSKIPLFLFYRDVYWNFPTYGKKLGRLKKLAAIFFYKMELYAFYNLLSRLYLPTKLMGEYLPNCPEKIVGELPPGCSIIKDGLLSNDPRLRLLYVGGVIAPTYDIRDSLDIVSTEREISLTIICRENEREYIENQIAAIRNVIIEHKTAKELELHYKNASIVMVFNRPTEYLSFAMPIKLFEAIGYGVPVLAREGTAAGDFVARERVGWVASGPEEARAILRRLAGNPGELEAMRRKVREAAPRHSWAERARQVARDAERIRSGRKSC